MQGKTPRSWQRLLDIFTLAGNYLNRPLLISSAKKLSGETLCISGQIFPPKDLVFKRTLSRMLCGIVKPIIKRSSVTY